VALPRLAVHMALISQEVGMVSAQHSTPDSERWQMVLDRDGRADGRFWYGVMTTGIYCRPQCPSRRPKPDNTRFFNTPEAARAAGLRPCKRCRPD
jgi:AraC family transcriptional regulator of adaptative response/methylated-DNA-[protein]-cysteine methyltransferase